MPTIELLSLDDLSYIEWAGFISEQAVFADAGGSLHVLGEEPKKIEMHEGLLAAKPNLDGSYLVTSGEDGLVKRFKKAVEVETLFHAKGKWIDRLATGPSGSVACAWGKQGVILTADGNEKPFECERSIEAIDFQPKGMRLALARYNGVDLKWINTNSEPKFLEWAGAHTDVIFSPDGKYVVSSMQENALHGWRLSDNKHMRMTGYPSKVKSFSWSVKGKWLASSGAPAAILWPFSGKDGPIGKTPKELGSMGNNLVTCVSCHPQEDVVAIGYGNGMILAVRIEDGKEAVLRKDGLGEITTMNWDKSGKFLAFGSAEGQAGIIDIAG